MIKTGHILNGFPQIDNNPKEVSIAAKIILLPSTRQRCVGKKEVSFRKQRPEGYNLQILPCLSC